MLCVLGYVGIFVGGFGGGDFWKKGCVNVFVVVFFFFGLNVSNISSKLTFAAESFGKLILRKLYGCLGNLNLCVCGNVFYLG